MQPCTSFGYYLCLLLCWKEGWSSCNMEGLSFKALGVYPLALYRKNLLISGLEDFIHRGYGD